jgi:hypothetical protein
MNNRKPSAEADRCLRAADTRFARHINRTGLAIAGGIILTFLVLQLSLLFIAKLFAIATLYGTGRVIYLIIQWQRTIHDILIGDGMTAREAAEEQFRRYG